MNIDENDLSKYKRDGFLIKKNFYSKEALLKLAFDIRKIICFFLKKNNMPCHDIKFNDLTFDNFDDGLSDLSKKNRKDVGLIYSLVKQLPSFINISSMSANADLYKNLVDSDLVCWAGSGNGIRIDLPEEKDFLYPWHQDFPYQMRSMDGSVFWTPLKPVTEELGPLEVAVGSHKNGVYKLFYDETLGNLPQGYKLRVQNADDIIKNFECIKVRIEPSDLLIFDFRLLHKSGFNKSKAARWSMQFRYFNVRDKYGSDNSWQGGYLSGKPIHERMPELFSK